MKRFLLLLILCGSAALGQGYSDDPRAQHLLAERALLLDRLRESREQSTYYRRRALFCYGDGKIEQMVEFQRKELFYRGLSEELQIAVWDFNRELNRSFGYGF